jgi:hypothetical protein
VNVKEFKLWFQGFVDGLGPTGMNAQQVSILKKTVNEIIVDDSPKTEVSPDKGSGGAPAEATPYIGPDIAKALDEIRRQQEEKQKSEVPRRSPFGGPYIDPFEPYDPMDPFRTGKHILYCQNAGNTDAQDAAKVLTQLTDDLLSLYGKRH